jgi:hypothetical protein
MRIEQASYHPGAAPNKQIVTKYKISDRASVHRHARALSLFERRNAPPRVPSNSFVITSLTEATSQLPSNHILAKNIGGPSHYRPWTAERPLNPQSLYALKSLRSTNLAHDGGRLDEP